MYIAVLDEVPKNMVPVVVAHAVLNADKIFEGNPDYDDWKENSFRKVVVSVNRKEFEKISSMQNVYLGYESTVLNGAWICAIPLPVDSESLPNVLRFSKIWSV